MEQVDKLEQRIKKLESQSPWRFFFQYLLSPLLILGVGTFINMGVEENRAELQRLTAAREMIPILFDGSPEKALATQRVLARTVDADLASELDSLVSQYYQAKITASVAAGDTLVASRIVDAAEAVGGAAAERLITSIPSSTRAQLQDFGNKTQIAARLERRGFELLLAGNITEAAKAFEDAEASYNGYHQVYELGRFLRRQPVTPTPQQRTTLLRSILDGYLYGAPPDLVARIREAANP